MTFASQLKLLLVTEKYLLARPSIHEALSRAFNVTTLFVEDGWPRRVSEIRHYKEYTAILWFVRYKLLRQAETFDWGDYAGERILYDQDALRFRTSVGFLPPDTNWPGTFKRHGFSLLLATGKRTAEQLQEVGVPAVWWPKAFDPVRLFDLGGPRSGICHFGTLYPSRRAMLHYLQRMGLPIEHLVIPYEDLNQVLNQYSALVVCTLANTSRTLSSRLLNRLHPEWGLRLTSGPEPMLKLFEGAGAGCAVFCDSMPELEDLGLIDGDGIIEWKDFSDLEGKLRYYLDRPETLRRIAARGSLVCRERHTWDARMGQLRDIVLGHT